MTSLEQGLFNRSSLLLGDSVMDAIQRYRVIIFGVGGVGSWCAESLIRSGIRHLTIVDNDVVSPSNVNRQLMATSKTIGEVKVDVLKNRLIEINPNADVVALQKIYSSETSDDFNLDTYDYIIDAIDSLSHKADLIKRSCETNAVLFSAMGAALKLDPTQIRVNEFWKAKGCPLARALRNKFKSQKDFPKKKFKVVYSEELLKNQKISQHNFTESTSNELQLSDSSSHSLSSHWDTIKAQINGTICHSVAIFGFTLAGLVIQDIVKKTTQVSQASTC
jgi:tRNA A37 threonylcarbamoyladenosine dehydratase